MEIFFLTIENVAPILCKYGTNFSISSSKAMQFIENELQHMFQMEIEITYYKRDIILDIVKKYRSGTSLEESTSKLISVIQKEYEGDVVCGYDDLTLDVSGNSHKVGDIAWKKHDESWIPCDGKFVTSIDYPDLYPYISNCKWNHNWGARAQMSIKPSVFKFNLPNISGGWIKAKK